MFSITAKYFSENFTVRYKLKLSTIVILEYIYSWLLSDNPPESKIINNKRYFYISQSHIADDFKSLITQASVSQKIKQFKDCGIIQQTYVEEKTSKFFICFDWDKVIESLAPQCILEKQRYKYNSNWFEKIFNFIDEEKKFENGEIEIEQDESYNKFMGYKSVFNREQKMLLDQDDMNLKKLPYSKHADAIAKKILVKYVDYFQNKIPTNGSEPTKTYIHICQKIDDIYNGRFTNPRFYNFDKGVFENKQFDTENWKQKINEVKGDWTKVKSLILQSVKNFILMWESDRMPLSKSYLTNNLNDWFCSENPNSKGQSQFIQSLNEPMFQKHKLGSEKAKKIVKDIKDENPVSYLAGHKLNQLLPTNASEVVAWKFIKQIIKWGKLLYQYDQNAKYFLECEIDGNLESGPKVLPALFADYLIKNKISVSLSTLDIEKSIDSNAPWCWFISDACKKHDLNINVVRCFNNQDFYDAYNESNKLTFDDMQEVIF